MLHHPKWDIRHHIGDATESTKHYLLSAPGLTLNASRSNYQFTGNIEDRIKDKYGGQDKEHHCKDQQNLKYGKIFKTDNHFFFSN